MNEAIISLIKRHCTTIRKEFLDADAAFKSIGLESDQSGLELIRAHIHKIKGSSGTLGFSGVCRQAEIFEENLLGLIGKRLSAAALAALRKDHLELTKAVASMKPESSDLYIRFAARTD